MNPLNYACQIVQAGEVRTDSALILPTVPRTRHFAPAVIAPQFAMSSDGDITAEGLHHNPAHYHTRYANLIARGISGARKDVPASEDWVLVGGHTNFYHFIGNFCARLHYYRQMPETGRRRKYVVAAALPESYYRYLELLGAPRDMLVKVPADRFFACSRLTVADLPLYFGIGLQADPDAFAWLSETLRAHTSPGPREKLFLTRKHTSHRRILDEDRLFDLARQHGYVRLCPEEHSPSELLGRFARAQALVTPFGAGATNALFCPPDCRVIELAGASALKKLNGVVFYALAGQASIRIVADEVGETDWQYRDLRVPPDDFAIALDLQQALTTTP